MTCFSVMFVIIKLYSLMQKLISDNDGMVDGPGYNSEEAQIMTLCYQYLLQSLSSIVSW